MLREGPCLPLSPRWSEALSSRHISRVPSLSSKHVGSSLFPFSSAILYALSVSTISFYTTPVRIRVPSAPSLYTSPSFSPRLPIRTAGHSSGPVHHSRVSMDPPLHWTRDPRYNQLRVPPVWYQRHHAPFWSPRLPPKMEKQMAEQRKHLWQFEQENVPCNSNSCVETTCCPCGVYSRTSRRLSAALGGRDVVNLPNKGVCTSSCIEFVACFPSKKRCLRNRRGRAELMFSVYACLLAKMQGTVRAFYDIDGNDASDWCSSCLCPCLTLARNENEILLRERSYNKRRANTPFNNQYKSNPPMEVPADWSRSDHSPTAVSIEGSDAEHSERLLKSIPETSREASMAGMNSRGISQSEAVFEDDTLVCADAGGTLTHQLDQDLELIPAEMPHTHELDKDPINLTKAPVDTSHDLQHDTRTEHIAQIQSHGLEFDETGPTGDAQRSDHGIHRDQIVAGPKPTLRHGLQDDVMISTPGPSTPRHELRDDRVTFSPPRQGQGAPHTLAEDSSTISQVATRKPSFGPLDGANGDKMS